MGRFEAFNIEAGQQVVLWVTTVRSHTAIMGAAFELFHVCLPFSPSIDSV